MTIHISNIAERRQLDALTAAMGTVTIHLAKNDFTDDDTTDLASFTQADYSSYANQTTTFGTAGTDGSGRASSISGTVTFPLAGSGSQTVYGWYATIGGVYWFHEKYASTVSVTTSAGVPAFTITYTLDLRP